MPYLSSEHDRTSQLDLSQFIHYRPTDLFFTTPTQLLGEAFSHAVQHCIVRNSLLQLNELKQGGVNKVLETRSRVRSSNH